MLRKAENEAERVLMQFCETIEAAGGVTYDPAAHCYKPMGDLEWTDLAADYLDACKALGWKPLIAERR